MPRIRPYLWFDDNADEAVDFYCSIFPNSSRGGASTYSEDAPGETGSTMAIEFQLDGRELIALNGGPMFSFTPAISLFVNCADQDEVDYYWDRLVDGGTPSRCGWLQDRYGLSWQIVPDQLGELLSDPDPDRANRAMRAMLAMSKLDVAALERAARGEFEA